jgi:hypothetical protein
MATHKQNSALCSSYEHGLRALSPSAGVPCPHRCCSRTPARLVLGSAAVAAQPVSAGNGGRSGWFLRALPLRMSGNRTKACVKPECDNFGKRGQNIGGHGWFTTKTGRKRRYQCKICGTTACTNTGTAYAGLGCTRSWRDLPRRRLHWRRDQQQVVQAPDLTQMPFALTMAS